MITQVFYNMLNTQHNVWSTTASDSQYNTFSRVHTTSVRKLTDRQKRKLMKQSKLKSKAYHNGNNV